MYKATEVFGKWAEEGRDVGMEEGHSASVNEMLNFALKERREKGEEFSFLDIGCGNGWVVRRVTQDSLCFSALGLDGAEQMIANANAKSRGNKCQYIHTDINSYRPKSKFDLVHSMEVMYYLEDPFSIIKRIEDSWLNTNGRLIIGIDLYYENKDSHSWEEKVKTTMLLLKESEWIDMFHQAGFIQIENWRANQSEQWAGTLVLTGKKT